MTTERRHTASSITDDALTALYDERDQLAAAVREVRALHRPVEGVGWGPDDDDTPGAYGDIAQACSACGTHDEYAVRWPCPTTRALPAHDTQETDRA